MPSLTLCSGADSVNAKLREAFPIYPGRPLCQCPWYWGCANAPSTSMRKQVAFICYHPSSSASKRSPHAQPPQFVPCKNRGSREWTLLRDVEAKLNSDWGQTKSPRRKCVHSYNSKPQGAQNLKDPLKRQLNTLFKASTQNPDGLGLNPNTSIYLLCNSKLLT